MLDVRFFYVAVLPFDDDVDLDLEELKRKMNKHKYNLFSSLSNRFGFELFVEL